MGHYGAASEFSPASHYHRAYSTAAYGLSLYAWIESLVTRVRGWANKRGDGASSDEIDTELRDLFLAEMAEVLESVDAALAGWRVNPSDADAHRQLRCGFHTLKGSAPGARRSAGCLLQGS